MGSKEDDAPGRKEAEFVIECYGAREEPEVSPVQAESAEKDGSPQTPRRITIEEVARNIERLRAEGRLRPRTSSGAPGRHSGEKTHVSSPSASFRIRPALLVPMLMLGWALLDFNPYAYYQLLRLVCFAVFFWQAYVAGNSGREVWAVVLLIAAFVYNPFLPLRLEREQWSVINAATIGLLLAWSWADWRWDHKKG